MLMVMDMSSGKIIQDEFGSFEDEVLNAGWVPAQPEVQLGLQMCTRPMRPALLLPASIR